MRRDAGEEGAEGGRETRRVRAAYDIRKSVRIAPVRMPYTSRLSAARPRAAAYSCISGFLAASHRQLHVY